MLSVLVQSCSPVQHMDLAHQASVASGPGLSYSHLSPCLRWFWTSWVVESRIVKQLVHGGAGDLGPICIPPQAVSDKLNTSSAH